VVQQILAAVVVVAQVVAQQLVQVVQESLS
jgi:hypothetical protein